MPTSNPIASKTLTKLLLYQWSLVLLCATVGWTSYSREPTALDQLKDISAEDIRFVRSMIEEIKPSGALIKEDIRQAEFFLQVLAEGTGWNVQEIRPIKRVPSHGIIPTDIRLVMTGDPFNLPVFLDGVYRQPAVSMIQSIELHMRARADSKVIVRVRYFEPEITAPSQSVLSNLSPGDKDKVEVGWELWTWQSWRTKAQELRIKDKNRRHDLQLLIAEPVIALRNSPTGEILWSEVGGLQVRE